VAPEGINGTICGTRKGIDKVVTFIKSLEGVGELSYKESKIRLNERPEGAFFRMRVRIKKEIVTMGMTGLDPAKTVGTYIEPKDWNALIDREDVRLIDTRNTYETLIGTFKGAVDPKTESFRQFPEWVAKNLDPKRDKSVAMFCTGGIRCEKATSYLLQKGFENVYHLKGGILNYLKEVPEEKTMWKGECYVFDERVSVSHGLRVGTYGKCRACRRPLSEEGKKHQHYEEGASCELCYSEYTEQQRQRFRTRHRAIGLAKARGVPHLGSAARSAKETKKRARAWAELTKEPSSTATI